jgi:phosphate-selective porin
MAVTAQIDIVSLWTSLLRLTQFQARGLGVTWCIVLLICSYPVLAESAADAPAKPIAHQEIVPEPEDNEEEVAMAALLGDEATTDLHDDTTLLRNVLGQEDRAGLVFFDALRIWVGGAVQYDYYNFDGIYNHQDDGAREEGAGMRRLEGIFRAQLFDWGEIKAQYDFDEGIFRNLYLRWVSERLHTPVTVTIGNQKEPMGLDNLSGNKFGIAQERSSPSSAFGQWRSTGVRLHRAFQLDEEDRKLDIFDDDAAFVTTSIGVFTEDIEKTNDTDLAVTARVTGGRDKDGVGLHFGLSGTYREGDFQQISFRPELREANRITLAQPQSNTLGIVGLESAYNRGRLHLQAEAYYAQYQGKVDGYGGGGYVQAAWFLTADNRGYSPRWGIVAPVNPTGQYAVEVFARMSHTRGDDDINGWNDFKSATVGSNFFFRKFRASVQLMYAESREPIGAQDDGVAINVRAQYLF